MAVFDNIPGNGATKTAAKWGGSLGGLGLVAFLLWQQLGVMSDKMDDLSVQVARQTEQLASLRRDLNRIETRVMPNNYQSPWRDEGRP